ncbi:5-oxoprolinase subunit B family protein [Alteromonas oceanisediminis]|uniref:5-oxoprolinase subunit B family protein n=1 Tax=Alteromonas oceanisediminis TaxID=2836180 RepID=UPI001BDB13C2|nr:allophanate hydrolase subunit 1 [Alteromonas oceanisediminis]MBT0586409.1 allophanate hydrolase subunit 1 [Alteromonas oceanisediminis]
MKQRWLTQWSVRHFLLSAENAITIYFQGDTLVQQNSRVAQLHRHILAQAPAWLEECVPAFDTLMLQYDGLSVDHYHVLQWLDGLEERHSESITSVHHTIDIVFDRADELDLNRVCSSLGMDRDAFIQRYCDAALRVYAIGFSPGFAYLGELPDSLQLPRRDEPRTVVPAGTLAIADAYTAIYPTESPGGWHLIGRYARHSKTLLSLNFKIGDTVAFRDVSGDE